MAGTAEFCRLTVTMGIGAGACITGAGRAGNGFVTSGVETETNGTMVAEEEAMNRSSRVNDGTSTGEAD
jgi:hypothetical protein